MAINFNTDPYYDDFSESKEFYRILFKPGRAVQAREITQLQTTLQNQVARFGQNIFKEGSIVIPGQQVFDKFYSYSNNGTGIGLEFSRLVMEDLNGSISCYSSAKINGYTVFTLKFPHLLD
jgi:nitrogen-specific signal transduction histidine kinase